MANHFSGQYPQEIRRLVIAAVLSGHNAIILGAPGYGKSEITESLAAQIVGEDWDHSWVEPGRKRTTGGAAIVTQFDMDSTKDLVTGPVDPAQILNGAYVYQTDNTAYDPRTLIALYDEVYRASPHALSPMLDSLNQRRPDRPVVIGSANFVVKNERTAALRDRFALWFWVPDESLDPSELVGRRLDAQGKGQGLQVDGKVPTWPEVASVRTARPGPQAIKAISRLVADLVRDARRQKRIVHPRRMGQWTDILFRVGMFYANMDPDFARVPDEAIHLLRYMWPALDPSDAAEWGAICGSVVDAVGSAVQQILSTIIADFESLAAIGSAEERIAQSGQYGQKMATAQASLNTLKAEYGDDERIGSAIRTVSEWFSEALNGVTPDRGAIRS